ncbi:MAG: hypothetical protein EZS28_018078, partial [Streblomastix strix]
FLRYLNVGLCILLTYFCSDLAADVINLCVLIISFNFFFDSTPKSSDTLPPLRTLLTSSGATATQRRYLLSPAAILAAQSIDRKESIMSDLSPAIVNHVPACAMCQMCYACYQFSNSAGRSFPPVIPVNSLVLPIIGDICTSLVRNHLPNLLRSALSGRGRGISSVNCNSSRKQPSTAQSTALQTSTPQDQCFVPYSPSTTSHSVPEPVISVKDPKRPAAVLLR